MKSSIFIILLIYVQTYSQWQQDVRLTNDPSASYVYSNWCIASSGNTVHVVWEDNRDNNYEIYYKRSTDGGSTWGADTRLTNNPANSYDPSVAVTGSVVHVIWGDHRDGNDEMYYKRSTDGGLSWGVDTRLTNNPSLSINPTLSVSGSVVHAAWDDNRDGNYEIYYKRSTDGGLSWGVDTRLTINTADSYDPSISVSGSSVHVVWSDNRDGNYETYYKRSTDGGLSWGVDTRLTNNPAISYGPSVAASASFTHIVWEDNRDGNYEIYYKRSTDGGSNWGVDTRLTNNSANSQYSSLAISGSVVHVVWTDNRDGNFEVYYKRDTTGNPVVISPISNEIPVEFKLYQNYPNPFNPSTVISLQFPVYSFVNLKIYDALGREVETLVNEQLKPGTYEIEFDGTNFSSGIYFYKLIARQTAGSSTGDFVDIKKMILIR